MSNNIDSSPRASDIDDGTCDQSRETSTIISNANYSLNCSASVTVPSVLCTTYYCHNYTECKCSYTNTCTQSYTDATNHCNACYPIVKSNLTNELRSGVPNMHVNYPDMSTKCDVINFNKCMLHNSLNISNSTTLSHDVFTYIQPCNFDVKCYSNDDAITDADMDCHIIHTNALCDVFDNTLPVQSLICTNEPNDTIDSGIQDDRNDDSNDDSGGDSNDDSDDVSDDGSSGDSSGDIGDDRNDVSDGESGDDSNDGSNGDSGDDSCGGSDDDDGSDGDNNDDINFDLNTISVIALNVCSFTTKKVYPDFINFIQKHDIICISESRLADTDSVDIDGFTAFYNNRDSLIRKPGGTLLLVRNCLLKYLTVYEENRFKHKIEKSLTQHYNFVNYELCRSAQWFTLNENVLGKKTLFCSVYIEGENSVYFNRQAYDELEEALLAFNIDHVCILGDFNSRCGRASDLLTHLEIVDGPHDIDDYGLSERSCTDNTRTNTMGHEFITFLKTCHLAMANGRLSDVPAKLTCKNASVVDYIVLSYCLFEYVSDFHVLEFNELFSDIHCPLNITFHCKNNVKSNDHIPVGTAHVINDNNVNTNNVHDTYVKWNNDSRGSFERGLNEDDIISVHTILDDLLNSTDNVTLENIDNTVNEIKDILMSSAKDQNMLKRKRKRHTLPTKSRPNPWYLTDCKHKRLIFVKARNKHIRAKDNVVLKQERKKAAKNYRKTVKKCKKEFDLDLANKLRNLKSKDPREFWNIINKHNNKNNDVNQPTCNEFLNMFKMFGEGVTNDENEYETDVENPILNDPIIVQEVINAIKKLKSNKAYGFDHVINEFLKYSCDKMSTVLMKLFNLVLETGIVPTDWVIGIIRPIYKNKGCRRDPNNYRGITILSCLGKLFTSILSNRINVFIENSGHLGNEQAGFRKNFSTADHLFTMYGILDILLFKKKRLYCAFLDFEKAFDKVDRAFLWQKLFNQKVNGKILKVIRNIYSAAKSCIMINDIKTDFFKISIGVRQGENLSPILFALFLNDMNEYMSHVMNGLETVIDVTTQCGMLNEEIDVFKKLFILLYADDTIIFAETPEKLQSGLNRVKQYCDRWKLKLNSNKCKVIIFSRGKVRVHPNFKIGDDVLEVVSDFVYLGMKLNYNNRMKVAQKDVYDRASRAMFSLLKKCKSNNLPIDIVLDLFDKTIVPIITYGCEVWGFDNVDLINKLQRKFFKIVLKLRKSTPNVMLYGETGTFPIDVIIKQRMLNFWFTLVSNENANKLSSLVYKCLYVMYKLKMHENMYVKYIRQCLIDVGLPFLWDTQSVSHISKSRFKAHIKQHTQDMYILNWHNTIYNSSICRNYNLFKRNFGQEAYLSILPYNCVISIIRFRTTNNALPVNTQRYFDVPREDRLCDKCNSMDVADEYHYLFKCEYFKSKREECLDTMYYIHPNTHKYNILFNSSNKRELLKLKHFIDVINANMR